MEQYLAKYGISVTNFFRCAYYWKFSRFSDCIHHIEQYEKDGTIPKFVDEYLKQITP